MERGRIEGQNSEYVVPHYKYCYISYNTTITSILFSAIIAFLVVMLLHLTVSRKSRNNLELAAKN